MTNFIWPIRVYYEDTDAGGVVYHSNYVTFMERARTEWLRSYGFEQNELKRDYNVLFVVRRIEVDFILPARFDDMLDVTVELKHIGKASLVLQQTVLLQNTQSVLCKGEVKIASIDADAFRPAPIPELIVETIKQNK